MFTFKNEVVVDGQKVVLDTNLMHFNEQTLGNFLQNMHGYYAYFGAMLCKAEKILGEKELHADKVYSKHYDNFKSANKTEKQAEALAKIEPDYIAAKEEVIQAKYVMRSLQQYIRSWDKAHENAQSTGHNLRKEMDKLGVDIRMSSREHDKTQEFEEFIKSSKG